ncbi:unnamed protein product [Linum trigynum]|uniref:Uncharacterized protein n=1 Tax=Linum trigynum TaxID=586398 RepID=A0AAV2GV93_9ROSI
MELVVAVFTWHSAEPCYIQHSESKSHCELAVEQFVRDTDRSIKNIVRVCSNMAFQSTVHPYSFLFEMEDDVQRLAKQTKWVE